MDTYLLLLYHAYGNQGIVGVLYWMRNEKIKDTHRIHNCKGLKENHTVYWKTFGWENIQEVICKRCICIYWILTKTVTT